MTVASSSVRNVTTTSSGPTVNSSASWITPARLRGQNGGHDASNDTRTDRRSRPTSARCSTRWLEYHRATLAREVRRADRRPAPARARSPPSTHVAARARAPHGRGRAELVPRVTRRARTRRRATTTTTTPTATSTTSTPPTSTRRSRTGAPSATTRASVAAVVRVARRRRHRAASADRRLAALGARPHDRGVRPPQRPRRPPPRSASTARPATSWLLA